MIAITLRQCRNNFSVADPHYIYPRAALARRTEREVAPVRGPTRILVGAVAISDLGRLATAERDSPDIEAPGRTALIREPITLGRECRRRVVIVLECDPARRAASERHRVDLRSARAIRGKCQRLPIRRNRRTHVDSVGVGELTNFGALARDQIQIGGASTLDRGYYPLRVRRDRSADHAAVRAIEPGLAPLLEVGKIKRWFHALVRQIEYVTRAAIETREQVDGWIVGQLEQFLTVDWLRIDFFEPSAAGRGARPLRVESPLLTRRSLQDSVGA